MNRTEHHLRYALERAEAALAQSQTGDALRILREAGFPRPMDELRDLEATVLAHEGEWHGARLMEGGRVYQRGAA